MMLEMTFGKLNQLKLSGMAEALTEQTQATMYTSLSFEERLGLLVDREITVRDNRRLTNLLRGARLRYSNACPEEIDFRTPRGLSKEAILSLIQNGWVKGKQNVIITGPTGSGKTFIACALANSACRSGHSAYYIRLPRLLQELHIARADGSYGKLLTRLAKYTILVIDDWGLAKLGDKERRDILEVLEDRHGINSTIVASQIPIEKWHDTIGDPTIADAVLDRLVHNAHIIAMSMKAESMRKLMSKSN
jgi:DNA replication protein DnaC